MKPSPFETAARGLFDWAQALCSAVVCVVLLFAFLCCTYRVDGPSMQNTLHNDERLLVSDLFYTPGRGDIVMFNKAHTEFLNLEGAVPQPPLVKRVVAVGGDTLDLDKNTGVLSINGKPLAEPYLHEQMSTFGSITFPVVVPEGYVFCMGDNRNNSWDSRDKRIGLIDERYILGRVLLRIFPLSKFGPVD